MIWPPNGTPRWLQVAEMKAGYNSVQCQIIEKSAMIGLVWQRVFIFGLTRQPHAKNTQCGVV